MDEDDGRIERSDDRTGYETPGAPFRSAPLAGRALWVVATLALGFEIVEEDGDPTGS